MEEAEWIEPAFQMHSRGVGCSSRGRWGETGWVIGLPVNFVGFEEALVEVLAAQLEEAHHLPAELGVPTMQQ